MKRSTSGAMKAPAAPFTRPDTTRRIEEIGTDDSSMLSPRTIRWARIVSRIRRTSVGVSSHSGLRTLRRPLNQACTALKEKAGSFKRSLSHCRVSATVRPRAASARSNGSWTRPPSSVAAAIGNPKSTNTTVSSRAIGVINTT